MATRKCPYLLQTPHRGLVAGAQGNSALRRAEKRDNHPGSLSKLRRKIFTCLWFEKNQMNCPLLRFCWKINSYLCINGEWFSRYSFLYLTLENWRTGFLAVNAIFEDLPSLGRRQKFIGKENTSPSRQLASSVLITPEGTSSMLCLLFMPFPHHLSLGHFGCVSVTHCRSLVIVNF